MSGPPLSAGAAMPEAGDAQAQARAEPLLAVAGSLAQKKLLAPSAGTFPTNRPLFVGLLVVVVLIIGGLTYFPAISLGPVVEQVAMNQGKLFPGP